MSWWDAIKAANEIFDKLRDAEAKSVIADLKLEGAKLVEENARLREENTKLKETADVRGRLVPENDVYWLSRPEKGRDGPFCQPCWDDREKLIRLQALESEPRFVCRVCGKSARNPNAPARPPAPPPMRPDVSFD
jgi:hypothetical protein